MFLFLLFLPITFFIYFYLNKKRLTELAKAFLVLVSLFFYSWWNVAYLPIILASMIVNFALGKQLGKVSAMSIGGGQEGLLANASLNGIPNNKSAIPNPAHVRKTLSRKALLVFGIIFNVALLGYFKYTDFFIENFNLITGADFNLLHIALPLAISFFTFQQIAYLVDSYRLGTKEYDFLTYALFVSFFPQLIAGPIVHHAEMMPQFANLRNRLINYKNIALGLFIFSIGLFKKVVIADSFAIWATNGFDKVEKLDVLSAWLTSLAYTFQLYFDFSGYCDMAIGAALLFNIKLPINFNSPYKSLDIQDFWRRWHITLGRFLRDYVYIPLGGSRAGNSRLSQLLRTCQNLFVTFLIGGIWHGAGWGFVIWGAMHGLALVIHRLWSCLSPFRLPKILAWFITFNFVNIAWVFFRATSLDDAFKVLGGMFGLAGYDYENFKAMRSYFREEFFYDGANGIFYLVAIGFILVLACKNSNEIINKKINNFFAFCFGFLTLLALLSMSLGKYSEFIYFNF